MEVQTEDITAHVGAMGTHESIKVKKGREGKYVIDMGCISEQEKEADAEEEQSQRKERKQRAA